MPRFYVFTFVLSLVMGWLIRDYFISYNIGTWKYMVGLLALIYINEKTSAGESVIRIVKKPSSVLFLILMGLIILLLLLYEGLV